MSKFNLQQHIDNIHQSYPAAAHQPIIGITANYSNGDACLRDRYYQQVVAAGGTPIIIPPVASKEAIINTLEHIDGLLLTGGGDLNPLWSGEEPLPQLHGINDERDLPELLITRLAYHRQIPILGICRGMQTLAVALQGKVCQDIETARKATASVVTEEERKRNRKSADSEPQTPLIKHSQDGDRGMFSHSVNIQSGTILHNIYGADRIYVNSFHHQAVTDAGSHFMVTAKAPDGTIEAMESQEHKSMLAVQWHPEWLGEEGRKLFDWLVQQANNFYVAKKLHQRILTLDTHCDTPMFFHQGIHFEQRDSRILVDLHKMTEGRQDAVIMAAYLPQPKLGEPFSKKVHFDVQTPFEYANLIFDKIEEIIHDNRRYISIARTPAELFEDKRKNRKSVMFAIENGLALDHKLANVKHFAQRGVVYITLCHNGDNDICDSAKGSETHHGVSKFGEQVIQEMNRQGIMVDLSHAAERSFYDALDISATPIVCSHSNCKALCNVPRNLSDDQMRKLAKRGGVMHITLYPGFLRQEGETSILDALEHLEHAIEIMGVEHVGLGTDFDGDGGVRGLADSSELINFTLHLLRRKYSERDIQKIWGGNWLRVMAQVQNSKG
ncbi:MAG: membrane dipeptidase [Prevotella sp.]|nr:membrane dipeptidase [Prevotella sp.]